MTTYKERLPPSEFICIETLHSAFCVARRADAKTYAPPGRLRHFDLIIIDEGSQVENLVWRKLLMAILELPQKPFVAIAADFQQLQPVTGGGD